MTEQAPLSLLHNVFDHFSTHPKDALLQEVKAGRRSVPTFNRGMTELICRARGTLRGRGVGAGDRVVLLARNSARWVAADLAIMAEGAVVVPLYARQSPEELAQVILDCQPKAVVYEDDELLMEVRSHHTQLSKASEPLAAVDYEEFFRGERVVQAPFPHRAEDLLTLIYTSGTGGTPKGVMLSAGNVAAMLRCTTSALGDLKERLAEDDGGSGTRVFHYLPFCFAGSRILLWTELALGQPLHLSTDLTRLRQELRVVNPHYMLNVPALLDRIRSGVDGALRSRSRLLHRWYRAGWQSWLKGHDRHAGPLSPWERFARWCLGTLFRGRVRARLPSALHTLICGSAPLSEETQAWFQWLGIDVLQVYGLTETTAIISMDRPGDAKWGTVGRALPVCETRVSDGGELWVRGDHLFSGYWQRDQETAEAFDGDWFRTGDLVDVLGDGRLKVLGRVKHVLVPSSGHNVVPEPLEQRLLEAMHGAEHAVVFGHGRPFLTAVISGKVDSQAQQSVLERVNRELPHYKRIRYVHVTEEPFTPENGLLTANQKLKRGALEDHFRPVLDRMYP